jgi:hypothetical protein
VGLVSDLDIMASCTDVVPTRYAKRCLFAIVHEFSARLLDHHCSLGF